MCKLRVHQDVGYNHLMIFGISPRHISDILSQPKPSGEELAALVSREEKEEEHYEAHYEADDAYEVLDDDYYEEYDDADEEDLDEIEDNACK